MRSALGFLLVTVLLAGFGSRAALADTPREQAGKHVVRGDGLKQRAEKARAAGLTEDASRLFNRAAEEYQAAYDLVPHPLMLYNLAQVYRLAGKHKEALEKYRGFLASNPEGSAADFARKYVRILRRTLESAGDTEDGQNSDDDDPDKTGTGTGDEGTGGGTDQGGKGTENGSPGGSGKTLQYGGLASAVVGLVSLGVGVKYGLDARGMATCLGPDYPAGCQPYIAAEVLARGGWSDEADKLEKKFLPRARRKMYIFGGLGVAAIAAGGVLYFLGENGSGETKSRQSLRIEPQVKEREVGLTISGSF